MEYRLTRLESLTLAAYDSDIAVCDMAHDLGITTKQARRALGRALRKMQARARAALRYGGGSYTSHSALD